MAAIIAAVLALIVATTTPAQAPGLPHLPPVPDRDTLRLRELVAKHAAGPLTSEEEAELIALLAKVKGIHVQKLSDLAVEAPLKGQKIPLPGFRSISLSYTKCSPEEAMKLRRAFDSTERTRFLKHLGTNPQMVARLKSSGLTDEQVQGLANRLQPRDYQVHHKLPLDDGGDNSFSNLLLIKHDPYHKSITNLQIQSTKGMRPGDTRILVWPVCDGFVYP